MVPLRRRKTYFRPSDWEEQDQLDPETYYETLRSVFSQNLPRYFRGRNRIGMSVTGGLDTRMIMAWWKAPPGSIPCYSFAGTYRDSHDVLLGGSGSRFGGNRMRKSRSGDAFLSRFPSMRNAPYSSPTAARMSVSRPFCTRTNWPADCADEDDWQLWQRGPSRKSDVQAGGALPGLFCSELTPHFLRPEVPTTAVVRITPSHFCRDPPGAVAPLRALCPRGDSTVGSITLPRQRSCPNCLPVSWDCATPTPFCLRLIADGNPVLRGIRTDRGEGRRRHSRRAVPRVARVHVQGRLRVQPRHAAVARAHGPRAFTASP